jgi:hypothetical protein
LFLVGNVIVVTFKYRLFAVVIMVFC